MKTILSYLFLLLASFIRAQENKNITLLDHWSEDTLLTSTSMVRYSGCFGFEYNNKEFAVIGSTEGSHIFELTKENKLSPSGFITGRFSSAQVIHREYKTYKNFLYAICDEGTSSLQIIDLSYLPDSVHLVADLQDIHFGKAHTIFIDTANELLYLCLVTPISNGNFLSKIPLSVYSLSNPLYPQLIWEGPDDIPEVHDVFIKNNIGILNCGTNGLRVYDFTEPNSPIYLNNLEFYQDQGYNHQGWLSDNGKTYVFADETSGMRIKKCTVDTSWNIEVTNLFGSNSSSGSIPHNLMITDTFAFVAYYNEGFKIFDIRSTPIEIGSYDTYLTNSSFKMNGAWGVFSQFNSKRIIVSDRQNGLFLFDFDRSTFQVKSVDDWILYPNPTSTSNTFTIRSPNDEIVNFQIRIVDSQGRNIYQESYFEKTSISIELPLSAGIYAIWIDYENYLGEKEQSCLKLRIY